MWSGDLPRMFDYFRLDWKEIEAHRWAFHQAKRNSMTTYEAVAYMRASQVPTLSFLDRAREIRDIADEAYRMDNLANDLKGFSF